VHDTTIDVPAGFGPGYEFEAFGRRWRAVGPARRPRGSTERPQTDPVVCRCIGSAGRWAARSACG